MLCLINYVLTYLFIKQIYVLVTSQKFEDLTSPIDDQKEQINNNQTEQLLDQLQQQATTSKFIRFIY